MKKRKTMLVDGKHNGEEVWKINEERKENVKVFKNIGVRFNKGISSISHLEKTREKV